MINNNQENCLFDIYFHCGECIFWNYGHCENPRSKKYRLDGKKHIEPDEEGCNYYNKEKEEVEK